MSVLHGWKTIPLIDVATLQRGYDLPVQDRVAGSVPILAATSKVGTHNCAKVSGPGVVTGRSGSIGNVQFVEQDYWPLNTTLYVKDFHGNEPRFIHYLLQHLRLERYHEGTGVPTLNRNNIHTILVHVPPATEQRRIAEVLDRAEELRTKRRVGFVELEGLTRAIFHEMFGDPATNSRGWPIARISDVSEVQGGVTVNAAREKNPHQVPYLRVANVYREFLDLTDVKRLYATDAEIARTALQLDDLLIVEGHGNPAEIGRSTLWDATVDLCLHQNHLIRVRFNQDAIVPRFGCTYLNSQGGRRPLLRAGKTTSGLNTISVSDVRSTPIARPPLPLQREFARRITCIERLKLAQRASLAEMDALFASLQHRAFRGEL